MDGAVRGLPLVAGKTPGQGDAWDLPPAFCIFIFVHLLLFTFWGVRGSPLPPFPPQAQRGEGPGKQAPPPLPPHPVVAPPAPPRPGAVYYCDQINRETLSARASVRGAG